MDIQFEINSSDHIFDGVDEGVLEFIRLGFGDTSYSEGWEPQPQSEQIYLQREQVQGGCPDLF